MNKNSPYRHEYNVLMTTLRNIIINILDRYGIEYRESEQAFYKKHPREEHKLTTLDDILKGI